MEKFSLKWNDFTSNVTNSFQSLRKEEDFFDVTLVGDDFKQVTAHKLVLSSCSEYFKKVFSKNKKYFQSQAMICLEGLNHDDLNHVLDYIYQGEVQIQQQELDRFLAIAERLKLEGLIGGRQHDEDENTKGVFEEEILTAEKDSIVSKHDNWVTSDDRRKEKPVISIQSADIQSLEELDQKVDESFTKDSTGFYSCNYCEKLFKQRCHIREHVEIHFEGLSFPCTSCDVILRSRKSFRLHRSRHLK